VVLLVSEGVVTFPESRPEACVCSFECVKMHEKASKCTVFSLQSVYGFLRYTSLLNGRIVSCAGNRLLNCMLWLIDVPC